MLAKLFRSNQPVLLVPAAVLLLLLCAPLLWREAAQPLGRHMPLYQALSEAISQWPFAAPVLVLLLLLLVAAQLQRMVERMGLFERPNHFVPLCFALLVALPQGPLVLSPSLLAAPLALHALHVTWRITNKGAAIGVLFDAGLLLGCAGLLHPAYLFFLAVLWASVSLIRPFHWREYVVCVVGAALPFFFHWAVRTYLGVPHFDPLTTLLPMPGAGPATWPSADQLAAAGLLLAPLLFAAVQSFNAAYQRGVVRDKNLRAAFLAFLFASAILALHDGFAEGRWPSVLLAMPLSVLLAHGLVAPRWPNIAEAFVLGLFAVGAWAQWVG